MFVKFNQNKNRFEVNDKSVSPASALSTRWLLHALSETRSYTSSRLLDVGCSAKPYEAFFGSPEHIGIDWSNSQHDLRADAFADAQAIPFADKTFDTVLCTEVIEHLNDPSMAVCEMARVLRPGGHLILSAPFVHVLHELPFDYFRYTHIGLQTLARAAGLNLVNYWTRGGILSVVMDLVGRLIFTWSRRFFFSRIPFRNLIETPFLNLFIVWPQRLFAYLVFGFDKLSLKWRRLRVFDTSTIITLGYVIVCQRTDNQ